MWNMTSFGILMPAVRPPHTVKHGDDRTMQIRTRRAKDLDILRARYMQTTLGPNLHTPDKDYEYRAYCTPHAFAFAMATMVLEIDYLKFKPTTVSRFQDEELHTCYNNIWGVVLDKLSSFKHQWEYWRKNPPEATYGPRGTAVGRAALPSGDTPVFDQAALRRYLDAEDQRIEDIDPYTGIGSYHPADLDGPADLGGGLVWDEHDQLVVETGDDAVAALYAEIDAILLARKTETTMDHSACDHAPTSAARARCRRRHRKEESRRIAELREMIDASYDTAYYIPEDPPPLVGTTTDHSIDGLISGEHTESANNLT